MMRLPKMDYHAAQSVEEACSVIAKYGEEAMILAGGTDLLPACKFRNLKPALLVIDYYRGPEKTRPLSKRKK